jgi:hypothetical protein
LFSIDDPEYIINQSTLSAASSTTLSTKKSSTSSQKLDATLSVISSLTSAAATTTSDESLSDFTITSSSFIATSAPVTSSVQSGTSSRKIALAVALPIVVIAKIGLLTWCLIRRSRKHQSALKEKRDPLGSIPTLHPAAEDRSSNDGDGFPPNDPDMPGYWNNHFTMASGALRSSKVSQTAPNLGPSELLDLPAQPPQEREQIFQPRQVIAELPDDSQPRRSTADPVDTKLLLETAAPPVLSEAGPQVHHISTSPSTAAADGTIAPVTENAQQPVEMPTEPTSPRELEAPVPPTISSSAPLLSKSYPHVAEESTAPTSQGSDMIAVATAPLSNISELPTHTTPPPPKSAIASPPQDATSPPKPASKRDRLLSFISPLSSRLSPTLLPKNNINSTTSASSLPDISPISPLAPLPQQAGQLNENAVAELSADRDTPPGQRGERTKEWAGRYA